MCNGSEECREITSIYFPEETTEIDVNHMQDMHRVFRAQTDRTLTHTSHKDTEQSTIEASITLDGITPTDSLIRCSPNK
jgi:hypothetical protein